jgi:hypothetical protein
MCLGGDFLFLKENIEQYVPKNDLTLKDRKNCVQ